MFNQDRKNAPKNIDAFVEERLSDYLDGILSDKERAIVEARLAESEQARASLESLRYTVNLLKQTPAPPLPRQFTLPIMSRAPVQRAPGWMVWGLRGVAVAATAAFVVLLTATVLRQPTLNDTASAPALQQPAAAVVALAPTPSTLKFSTQSSSGGVAAGPTMITAEPPTDVAEPLPITQAPPTQRKAASVLASPTLENKLPALASQNPTVSEAADAAPTATAAKPAVSIASANNGTETTPAPAETSAGQATANSASLHFIQGFVTTEQLRVRRGPGLDYRSLGVLKMGDPVNVVGRNSDDTWLVIQYPLNLDTGLGWIDAASVQMNELVDTLPVFDNPPLAPAKPQGKPTLEVPPSP